ncbi:MAG: peroxiredoxin, partial [Candidatus Omnitrophota bacterium]
MLTVGDRFPCFNLKAVVSNDPRTGIVEATNDAYKAGWLVVFFWPKDFSAVCPTEIEAFGRLEPTFRERGAQILGCSTDSEMVHLDLRNQKLPLNRLPYPMLSDVNHVLCDALGIFDAQAGLAKRATYLVDPLGKIRFAMMTDWRVGRNPEEVLRVLDALQTDKPCPCNWKNG